MVEQKWMEEVVTRVKIALQDLPPDNRRLLRGIPVGISNRHIHLSHDHADILFGPGYVFRKKKDMTQEGEFAAVETVTLVGPKGVLRNVRVLGPLRKKTQVEISRTDSFTLGIGAPVRDSGQLAGSSAVAVVGPKGAVTMPEGMICAARHIHMHPDEAEFFGVRDREYVCVETLGVRGVVFKNVLVRVNPHFRLEMHMDVDEANAAGLNNGDLVYLLRRE